MFDDFASFLLKRSNKYFVKYCIMSKAFFITKTIAAVLPRGSKKRKSNNDDNHDQGQKKRRSSTYVEGKRESRQVSAAARGRDFKTIAIARVHLAMRFRAFNQPVGSPSWSSAQTARTISAAFLRLSCAPSWPRTASISTINEAYLHKKQTW